MLCRISALLLHHPPLLDTFPALSHHIRLYTPPQSRYRVIDRHQLALIQRFFLIHTRVLVPDGLIPFPFHINPFLERHPFLKFGRILIGHALFFFLRGERYLQGWRDGFRYVPEEDVLCCSRYGDELRPYGLGDEGSRGSVWGGVVCRGLACGDGQREKAIAVA